MEESKRKLLDLKLHRLFAQENELKEKKMPVSILAGRTKIIRRRKGKPDFRVA